MRRGTMQRRVTRARGILITATLATFASAALARAADPPTIKDSWPAAKDRAAILRLLRDTSRDGMDRRLGPDYAAYHKGKPEQTFPDVWMPPSKQDPGGRRYQ